MWDSTQFEELASIVDVPAGKQWTVSLQEVVFHSQSILTSLNDPQALDVIPDKNILVKKTGRRLLCV